MLWILNFVFFLVHFFSKKSPYSSIYFVVCLQFVFQITFVSRYTVPQVLKISYLFNQIVFHNFHPLYVVGILWVTEPYEIKDHIQEYQNTPV